MSVYRSILFTITIVGIAVGVHLGLLVTGYNEHYTSEVGYCHIKNDIYCVDGKLLYKNPSYLTGNRPEFSPYTGWGTVWCTCKDINKSENIDEIVNNYRKRYETK